MGDVIKLQAIPVLAGFVYGSVGGGNVEHQFYIRNYEADDNETAWSKMRRDMLETFDSYDYGYRFEVGLGWLTPKSKEFSSSSGLMLQLGLSSIGDKEWLNGIEYFKSYVGDVGSSDSLESAGFGYIDKFNHIRVEFMNGRFLITKLKE